MRQVLIVARGAAGQLGIDQRGRDTLSLIDQGHSGSDPVQPRRRHGDFVFKCAIF